MRCIIIDRDRDALKQLKLILEGISFVSIDGEFSDPVEAWVFMRRNPVDLVFSEVEMPLIAGSDVVFNGTDKPLVAFVTDSNAFAVKAFEIGALDYIMKPFTFERILKTVLKAYDLMVKNSTEKSSDTVFSSSKMNLFVKSENKMMRLLHQDILFFEGYSDYVRIYTTSGKPPLLSLLNLKSLDKRLPVGMYCRVHRSYIVAIDKIDFVERKRIGINNHIIPISDTYASVFFGLIREMELSG